MTDKPIDEAARNSTATRAFFDAMNKGDPAEIAAAYDEDGYCQTMGQTLISGKYSRDQVVQAASHVLQLFPKGIRFDILNITAQDDRVAVEATSQGEHVSGRTYANHYHFLFRFRDGKILSMQEFMDTEMVTDILCGGQRPEGTAG